MTPKIDAEFKEKLISGFKNDKNLVNFDLITRSFQNFYFFLFSLTRPAAKMPWSKCPLLFFFILVWATAPPSSQRRKCRGVNQNVKIKIKMSTLIGSFCSKYITFDLKKRREVTFHDTYGFENDMKNMPNFHCTWKISKLGLWWDPGVQSRKFMSLKFTEVLCVMTMKNDDKFEEELTCRFKIDMKNLTNFDLSTKKSQKFAP